MTSCEELLTRFAEINSHSLNSAGLQKMVRALKHEVVKLKPDHLEFIELENGPALYAEKRTSAPCQIYLGGHFDTVHPELWELQKRQNRLYGPGVLDMKGGLAILLKSLEAFEQFEQKELLGWRLFFNPDEELGSPYSARLVSKFARKCDAALIFEPSLANGNLVNARKGSVNFICEAKGKAAHVGRNPELGDCAITKLSHFIIGIKKLSRKNAFGCVGTIQGGIAGNVVADHASCQLNFRFDECYPKEQLNRLAKRHGVRLIKKSERAPKPFDPKNRALFRLLRSCAKKLGYEVAWQKTGGVCDGNETARVGVPTIDTLGAEGDKLHTKGEYLLLSSLEKKRQITTALLEALARGKLL
ncbi:MAG: Carboxypeptidase G2 [Chlamydiales bacterium]|nr:Carboxypeptidase G2 [Chlamydiales bacterium]MCH9634946.1 Carboxypeptidase G2 [Chlamydiales bacterium]MCH9703425.1 M20/M25/M40 family metallo-hydrolase [Chlamydiota bacterium]